MANPVFEEGSLPRRKQPGEALTGKDSLLPIVEYGIHNTTPPTLANGDVAPNQMDDMGNQKMSLGDPAQVAILSSINGFQVPNHDEITLSYTSGNLTGVVYKLSTVAVATLTLSYDGDDNLTGIVKT